MINWLAEKYRQWKFERDFQKKKKELLKSIMKLKKQQKL